MKTLTPPATRSGSSLTPGILAAAVGTALAAGTHLLAPALSTVIVAVLLGVLVGNLPVLPASTRPGLTWATKHLLRIGVVFLGLKLAIPQLLGLGAGALLAVVITVVVGFLGTIWLGRLLGVPRGLAVLVGTGFSVCGASAIAAMEGIVDREDEDVATSVALVTLFGSLAILGLPVLGEGLAMNDRFFGEWAGIGVHEVAQVVATASALGGSAVAAAVVVKLTRVLLLAPLVAAMNLFQRHRGVARTSAGRRPPIVPWFVAGFLVMVCVRSTGVVPHAVLGVTDQLTTLLLAAALFGLGSTVRVGSLIRTGPRAVLLGLCSTVLVAGIGGVSLALLA